MDDSNEVAKGLWCDGFLCALYLMTGDRERYEELRDEHLARTGFVLPGETDG